MKIYSNGKMLEVGGGSGGGSSWETYSTEEQRIGTWIDGKPLYRQVYNVRTPATVNTSSSVTVAKYPTTCQFTKINALIFQEGSMAYTVLPAIFGTSNFYAGIFLQNGDLRLMAGHKNYANQPVIVIMEYTKTTDEATIDFPTVLTPELEESNQNYTVAASTAPVEFCSKEV